MPRFDNIEVFWEDTPPEINWYNRHSLASWVDPHLASIWDSIDCTNRQGLYRTDVPHIAEFLNRCLNRHDITSFSRSQTDLNEARLLYCSSWRCPCCDRTPLEFVCPMGEQKCREKGYPLGAWAGTTHHIGDVRGCMYCNQYGHSIERKLGIESLPVSELKYIVPQRQINQKHGEPTPVILNGLVNRFGL